MEALRIRIPERYQSGIAKLIFLPQNAFEELLFVLNETPQSLNLDTIKSNAISHISNIPEGDIGEILSALDSLYYIKNDSSATLEEFSDQVLQAMEETGIRELRLEADLREQFKNRLIRMLSGTLFDIVVKSRDVLYQHERLFGSARVISDIRLVFGESEEGNPKAAVIVHSLKLHYIQNNEHKEFFVALDDKDIGLLIDELIRAQEQAETLKSTLATANVPYIDVE
jgi:hypothetical protein